MSRTFFDDMPFVVTKMPDHKNFKDHLLDLIDKMPRASIDKTNSSSDDHITKSDWNIPEEYPRPYLDFIKPRIIEAMTESLKPFKFNGIAFTKFWFQQYVNGDIHDWHVHSSCHWTNVYYIELPDKNFKTEIQNWNRTKLVEFDIEEGDMIMFPSFLYHRCPRYHSTQRKTIMSFNLDLLSSYD